MSPEQLTPSLWTPVSHLNTHCHSQRKRCSIRFVRSPKAMENYWMYQVEKLEEEQAKQKQQTDQHDGDEVWMVWRVHDDFGVLKCWFLFVAVVESVVSGVLRPVESFNKTKFLILKPVCGFIQKLRVVLLANTVVPIFWKLKLNCQIFFFFFTTGHDLWTWFKSSQYFAIRSHYVYVCFLQLCHCRPLLLWEKWLHNDKTLSTEACRPVTVTMVEDVPGSHTTVK